MGHNSTTLPTHDSQPTRRSNDSFPNIRLRVWCPLLAYKVLVPTHQQAATPATARVYGFIFIGLIKKISLLLDKQLMSRSGDEVER